MRTGIAVLGMICVVAAVPARAQTPRSMFNAGGLPSNPATDDPRGASAVNPWLGAQLGYQFGEDTELANNLLVSARLLTHIDVGSDVFGLPVMGNIAALKSSGAEGDESEEAIDKKLQDLISTTQGLYIGLYPYYYLANRELVYVTLHGSAGWRLNAFQDSASTEVRYLNQGRFSFGLEVGLGQRAEGAKRMTLSVAPTWTVFSPSKYRSIFDQRRSSIMSTEITGVLPTGSNMGLLLEAVLSNDVPSTFRVGALLVAEAK